MKTIYCLPVHPDYFDGRYTQKQIEVAIVRVEKRAALPQNSSAFRTLHFCWQRTPGKHIGVVFDDPNAEEWQSRPEQVKEHATEQY